MAEIDREKVIKDLEECLSASCRGYRPRLSCPYNDEEWNIMRDALALLKEQEDRINDLKGFINGFSKDAVPVVRCKNCLYWRKFILNKDGHGACALDGRGHAPDWFCPDGTRRDNNGNE